MITIGVTVVAAAGNSNIDASTISPAHNEAVITVGASDVDDVRATFSNYGAVLDLFAPGVNIISAAYTSDTGYLTKSGTSMVSDDLMTLIVFTSPD